MASVLRLGQDMRGTCETLAVMLCVAADPRVTARVRRHALVIVQGHHTPEARCRALYRWMRSHVGYIYDPPTLEYVERPWSLPGDDQPGLLELALMGSPSAVTDCDGHAVLMASLCQSLGIEPKMVITQTPDSVPLYEHVHCAANVAGPYEPERWVDLDTSLPHTDFGRPHKGVGKAEARLGDLDKLGLYERGVMLGSADAGPGGIISGVLELAGGLIRSAIGMRAARDTQAAIDEASRRSEATTVRIETTQRELDSAQRSLADERLAFWDARNAARREVSLARLKEPIVLGSLALVALGVVIWFTRR